MAKRKSALPGVTSLLLLLPLISLSVTEAAFKCEEEGFFSKPDSCHVYYDCVVLNGALYSRLWECSLLELFDDIEGKCVSASQLTSPSRCVRGTHAQGPSIVSEEGPFTITSVNATGNPRGVDFKQYGEVDITESVTNDTTEDSATESITEICPEIYEDPTVDESLERIKSDDSADSSFTESLTGNKTKDLLVTDHHFSRTNKSCGKTSDANTTSEELDEIQDISEEITDDVTELPVLTVDTDKETFTICEYKNMIEVYVNLVIRSPHLRNSVPHQLVYNRIIKEYNKKIENAQTNTHPWRRGVSISTGLSRSHQKANGYKEEFSKKFATYKRQILGITSDKRSPQFIQRIEKDIQNLKEGIKVAEESLNITDVPEIRKYLQDSIDDKKKEIKHKELDKISDAEGLKLAELASFLRFVSNDAGEVEDQLRELIEKIDSFLDNVNIDAHVYDILVNSTYEGDYILNTEAQQIEQEIKLNEDNQDQLERLKKTLNDNFDALTANRTRINGQISVLRDRVEKKIDEFNEKKKKLCMPGGMIDTFINPMSTKKQQDRACQRVLKISKVRLNTEVENAQLERLHLKVNEIDEDYSNAVTKYGKITPQLRKLSGNLQPKRQRLEQIEFEVYNIQTLAKNLEQLQKEVNAATNSISEVKAELQGLRDYFNSLVRGFEEMSNVAATATFKGERDELRASIENELHELQEDLQNQEMKNISDCSTK